MIADCLPYVTVIKARIVTKQRRSRSSTIHLLRQRPGYHCFTPVNGLPLIYLLGSALVKARGIGSLRETLSF